METDVVLVRHGRTAWNQAGRIQGHINSDLDELGQQQAHAVMERLKDESFDHIYSSDLKRAFDTARPAAESHGLTINPLESLREWHLGAFEGLTYEDAKLTFKDAFERFSNFDPDAKVPDGESFHQFYDRSRAALDEIARKHPGQSLLVFTHGGFINCILRVVHQIPLTSKIRYHVGNTSVTRVCATHTDTGLQWRLEATDCDPIEI